MSEPPDSVIAQTGTGVFGLAGVVDDFDDADVARLRAVAEAIRSPERPDVNSAIALSGSAAQSRFQPFPGDADFFERVHIRAADRDAAIDVLVAVMIETVARTFPMVDLQFVEMKLGLHADDRTPISWSLADIDARFLPPRDGDVAPVELRPAAKDPGFVKLDWVHADVERGRVTPVSKVIDATWEDPDGQIVPLDGVLDSFYQEVYLDPDSKPYVERLIDQVSPDGLRDYIAQLEHEIRKYTQPGHENYGKVAKRLYNVFRLTNMSGCAAHVRGLFDDPPASLYPVSGMVHALEQAMRSRRLPPGALQAQLDTLAGLLRERYEGADRDQLAALVVTVPELDDAARGETLDHIAERCSAQVSAYFEARLREDPEIAAFLDSLES